MPANAALINYSFSGEYGNSQGPLKKGSFVGTMTWDTEKGSGTAPNKSGGWSYWDIINYEDGAQNSTNYDGRLSSHSIAGITNPWDASTLGSNAGAALNSTAFCFASPLAKGLAAEGPFSESVPGGSTCDGSYGTAYGAQSFFAVGQQQAGVVKPQGNNTVATNWKYFRLAFVPQYDTNGKVLPDQLQLQTFNPGAAQSQEWIGISYLVAKTDPSYCYGDNNYKESNQRGNSENRCPYSGNTQDSTGIRTANLVPGTNPPPEPGPDPAQTPAPLPLFGAGLAFGWSRRIRRRVNRGSALAPIAVVG